MVKNIPANSWVRDKVRLSAIAHQIDKSIRLYTKDNWFCKALACILVVVTFGGMKYRDFLKRFATTIGPLQFYPVSWTVGMVERVAPHEGRHTVQARWFGLWIHPFLGLPLYSIFYLLLFLPVGLAYFRCWFEMDAERFALSRRYKQGEIDAPRVRSRMKLFCETVCSWKYGKSLPLAWGMKIFNRGAEDILNAAK